MLCFKLVCIAKIQMESNTFSKNLIDQTRAYFSKKYGRVICVEEAVGFLNSLADLYEQFGVMTRAGPACPGAAEPPGTR